MEMEMGSYAVNNAMHVQERTIVGTVKSVFYSSPSWSSIVITGPNGNIKCVGNIPSPAKNIRLELDGFDKVDPKYGKEFQVRKCRPAKDMSAASLKAYLASGYIKGCGEATAQALVDAFGADTLDVIANHPERLKEVKGISDKKAQKLHDSHIESLAYTEIFAIFDGKVTDRQAKAIFDTYGKDAPAVICKNPYQLIYDIDGFGFQRVDALALSSGIAPDSEARLGAAIAYALLDNSAQNGACYMGTSAIEHKMIEVLRMPVDPNKAAEILAKEIESGRLIYESEDDRLYLRRHYEAETYCAREVARLAKSVPFRSVGISEVNDGITRTQARCGFALTDKQKGAVFNAVTRGISIITGGPGCGKTTIVRAIAAAWGDKDSIQLLAPTGKASRRLSEAAGNMKASTIHRMLASWSAPKGASKKRSKEDEDPKLVICDEASMLDILLAQRLMRYISETGSSLVLIGDADQLPPIGPGAFFRDLLTCGLPKTQLDLSHRNSGSIALNAYAANSGSPMSAFKFDDQFRFIPIKDKEGAINTLIGNYESLVKDYGIENVCCLLPTRKEGKEGTPRICSMTLNRLIREKLNPEKPGQEMLPGCPFRKGDRVMQTVNDYKKEVFNGDCGIVVDVSRAEEEIYVRLDSGMEVAYSKIEASALVFAYAMTIHKAQGSEYDAVVVAQCPEHTYMLQRNLFYTGITRARKKVVLIGDPKTVNIAIHKVPATERATALRQRVRKLLAS